MQARSRVAGHVSESAQDQPVKVRGAELRHRGDGMAEEWCGRQWAPSDRILFSKGEHAMMLFTGKLNTTRVSPSGGFFKKSFSRTDCHDQLKLGRRKLTGSRCAKNIVNWMDGIDGERVEFEWTKFPGHTTLQLLREIRRTMEDERI